MIDLNRPTKDPDPARWEETLLDTVLMLAALRNLPPERDGPGFIEPPRNESRDSDDADITWEDAEWR